MRIRWQITEELLLGRLAYERIENGDGTGMGGPTEDGQIVVAYAIESHFDIVRSYNPTTGEQINVLEENSIDRPWNERQYMRVDWSRSLNSGSYDFDTLSGLEVMGSYHFEPLDYDVTDPNDPDAPVLDLEHGYFDITSKVMASPQTIDISHLGWGYNELPECWFDGDFMNGTYPWGNCNPTEVTIRQSFLRVEDRDFQPLDWDGWRFQAFGGLTEYRLGFARNYGMSDDMWHRFLDHHNIWERSHYYADPVNMTGAVACYTPETTPYGSDPHRDVEPRDGTEDECAAAGPGSQCDVFTQKCTLPYAQRTPKVDIIYYTNGSNPEYFEPTARAVHDWDVGLRVAIRAAQYAECRATGGAEETCLERFPVIRGQMDDYQDATWLFGEVDKCRNGWAYERESNCDALADRLGRERDMDPAVIDMAKMDEMFVLCHSPVQADDPEVCGGPRLPADITAEECQYAYRDRPTTDELVRTCREAFNVRRGDLRYNKMIVVWEPQTLCPWGFGADSVDPLNGEVVAMNTSFWSHVTDYVAQDTVDKLRFLKGELDVDDVTEGEYVRNWAQAAESAARGGVAPLMSRAQLGERLAAFGGVEDAAAIPTSVPAHVREAVQDINRALKGVRASVEAPSNTAAVYAARRRAARGTAFEAELVTPMVQQYAGVVGMPMEDGVMDLASPLRGGDPELRLRLQRLKEEAYAQRGVCLMHPREAQAPFALGGLADILQEKFGEFNRRDSLDVQQERAERMRKFIAYRMHHSAVAHEFGHSLGLRHDFVGSSDAYIYRPQYWQLRTKNGTVSEPCTELTPDGEACVGPRWFDPVTEEERDNLIWMWSTGSIMDYPGEYTQDMLGPGVWDFAGVRIFYGDTVAMNPDPEYRFSTAKGRWALDKMDNFGGILGIRNSLDDGDPLTNNDFHYSQLQNKIGMIHDCVEVDPYQPFQGGFLQEFGGSAGFVAGVPRADVQGR
ncbi:MAG: hypothetical protein JXB32_05520, partial [Deltaproteobacteria bacterium]|nr:hypothetical protein [Deltaproteobacteria bacterium]